MTIEIANRLVEFRKKKGYSQEQIAEMLGVSRQSVSNWESGEVTPSIEYFGQLAKIYGCTIDDLYNTEKNVDDVLKEEEKYKKEKKKTDTVNINPSGIHIKSEDGDEVHIGASGIHVYENSEVVDAPIKNSYRWETVSGIITGISVIAFIVAYLILGFLGEKGSWGRWWVLLVLIPVPGCIVEMFRHKKFSDFPMALVVTFLYLFAGTFYGRWSPEWVIFFAIPVYHIIAGGIDKLIGHKTFIYVNGKRQEPIEAEVKENEK